MAFSQRSDRLILRRCSSIELITNNNMKPILPVMTVLLAALLAILPGEAFAQDAKIQVRGSVLDVNGTTGIDSKRALS